MSVTPDLYSVPLKFGAFERPCGCNQGTDAGESCVLIASIPGGGVALRDSKLDPQSGPELRFSAEEWQAFLRTQHIA